MSHLPVIHESQKFVVAVSEWISKKKETHISKYVFVRKRILIYIFFLIKKCQFKQITDIFENCSH